MKNKVVKEVQFKILYGAKNHTFNKMCDFLNLVGRYNKMYRPYDINLIEVNKIDKNLLEYEMNCTFKFYDLLNNNIINHKKNFIKKFSLLCKLIKEKEELVEFIIDGKNINYELI